MKKEITGYKLKDEKYRKFAEDISGFLTPSSFKLEDLLMEGNQCFLKSLKEEKVLDLWFEPVYKEDTTLEVGKWYKKDTRLMFCFNGKYGNSTNYGFNHEGDFSENIGVHEGDSYRELTDKEVEEALIKEAKKRGFKEGVQVKYLDNSISKWSKEDNGFLFKNGCLCLHSHLYKIFYNGKWAEAIESDFLPKINGYQGEDKGTYLKYGCAELPKAWFENTEFNRSLKSIKLCSGVKIGKSEIAQISEYLNAK